MLKRVLNYIHEKERAWARSFGNDISTPRTRFTSKLHFQFMDHGILRHLWTNFDEVAPGVYRSNQPDARRLRRAKAMGVKTILNLRGTAQRAHYLFEKETCDALGLELVSIPFNARSAPWANELLHVIDLFRTIEKPFLLHCKSGADRAGFISAVYLLTQENATVDQSRKQLSFKYLHLKNTATGILDHVLDMYEPHAATMDFEEWVKHHYDRDAAIAGFAATRTKAIS